MRKRKGRGRNTECEDRKTEKPALKWNVNHGEAAVDKPKKKEREREKQLLFDYVE